MVEVIYKPVTEPIDMVRATSPGGGRSIVCSRSLILNAGLRMLTTAHESDGAIHLTADDAIEFCEAVIRFAKQIKKEEGK